MDMMARVGRKLGLQNLEKLPGSGARRSRILARDQAPIDNGEHGPIGHFFEVSAQTLQLILDKEGHDLGQADGFLFIIGEAGDALAFDERLSFIRGLSKYTRAMTDGGNRLASVVEILDQ